MTRHKRLLTRRQFLKTAGAAAAGAVAAACAPAATPTAAPAATSPPAATTAPQATAVAAPTIQGGPIEIGTFYEEGPWFDFHKAVGDSLEKDFSGTKVKYTFNNTASDPARVLRWQAGDALDLDVGRWNNQAPATYQWVDDGWVHDLSPYMEDVLPTGEKWGDTFLPLVNSMDYDSREGSKTKGKRFSVSVELVLFLIHYNQKAFDEMGVAPVATWPEFLTLCQTINEKGKAKGMKPICVSGPTDVYVGHWWDRMIQRTVGLEGVLNVIYGKGHVKDDPGFLTAAKELEKIPANDWLMEGYEGADFTAAQALFFQGKAAMIHMGSWLVSEMADAIPDDFVVGTFDFPSYPGGKGDQGGMFGTVQGWSIPNPDKVTSHKVNVPLAVEWLKRRTSKATTDAAAEKIGMISPIKGGKTPPRLPEIDKALEKAANSQFIIYYYGIHWDTALWAAWYPYIQALWLKKINAEQMIEQLDTALDKYRAQKAP